VNGDLLLAVVGLSAGAGSAVGWWAALWWRDHIPFGHKQLTRRLFVHVDDLVGATRTENQIRAGKRFAAMRPPLMVFFGRGGLGKTLGKAWADLWWPIPPQAGGTTVRPSTGRMGQYVRLEFGRPLMRTRPFRIWDITAVTVWWTSEAAALTGNLGENVGRKVAQALRLESVDQLDIAVDYDRGCIRYTRKAPAPEFVPTVPVGVNADA
jgi:hypothetical protein